MVEWLIEFWNWLVGPRKNINYLISEGLIRKTEEILKQYGSLSPPNEGFVYWAGRVKNNRIYIDTLVAPETKSSEGSVEVSKESNFFYVKSLSDNKVQHLAQVHTHPSDWVGHSAGDDEWASFKSDGLISIVVSNYGSKGILPIEKCGVHRFQNNKFQRLDRKYVSKRFKVIDLKYTYFDLRNKNDQRWKG